MNKQQPQKLTLAQMQVLVGQMQAERLDYHFEDDFAWLTVGNAVMSPIVNSGEPFRIDDYRCGLVLRGELHGLMNLQKINVQAGAIVVMTPGTILQPEQISPDFSLMGMGVAPELMHIVLGGQLPSVFYRQMHETILKDVPADDFQVLCVTYRALRRLTSRPDYSREARRHLIASIVFQVDHLASQADTGQAKSRQQQVFDRFIRLVNEHCRTQHQLSFYADRLCLTERYLGTLVHQASGTTAKQWIDRALIMQAKVLLKHSADTAAQIADTLCFPNPSFFTKYFRRLTGLTPLQYREA